MYCNGMIYNSIIPGGKNSELLTVLEGILHTSKQLKENGFILTFPGCKLCKILNPIVLTTFISVYFLVLYGSFSSNPL